MIALDLGEAATVFGPIQSLLVLHAEHMSLNSYQYHIEVYSRYIMTLQVPAIRFREPA